MKNSCCYTRYSDSRYAVKIPTTFPVYIEVAFLSLGLIISWGLYSYVMEMITIDKKAPDEVYIYVKCI